MNSNMLATVQYCEYFIQGGSGTIVISNALTGDYSPESGQSIKFRVFNMKLPPSEAPTGAFEFVVSSMSEWSGYLKVDAGSMSNMF
jgi:hypothetical protein